jgi:hypothetical protein
MKLYDHTLDGWASNKDIERTVRFISEYAEEVATEQNKPLHSRLFKVYKEQKINVWYDFGADYYFFEDVTE